jgi:hypothetical protein
MKMGQAECPVVIAVDDDDDDDDDLGQISQIWESTMKGAPPI